jgi:hypothetical protein
MDATPCAEALEPAAGLEAQVRRSPWGKGVGLFLLSTDKGTPENQDSIFGNTAKAAASPAFTSSGPHSNPSHAMSCRSGVMTRSLACRQPSSERVCMIWKHRRMT